MYRFWIAHEGRKGEQIYDAKLKTLTWTHKQGETQDTSKPRKPDDHSDGVVKRMESLDSTILKGPAKWTPIGKEVIHKLVNFVIMAGVPNQYGEVYTDEELREMATASPDDWTYVYCEGGGFVVRIYDKYAF